MSATWQVGVDIGGTFTDIVALDPADGMLRAAKVRSISDEPEKSLDVALATIGLNWGDVADLMHGTTMATNAIVQNKLSPVALIATEGFGDTLEIGRQDRRDLYRLDVLPKLLPLVPESLRLEVAERVDVEGQILMPLAEEAAESVVQEAMGREVEAVAVALLNAYANPVHERALGARLAGAVPYVALSHRVNPEEREYERTSVTVLNAALMPRTSDYVDKLSRRALNGTRLHLFHSAGGMAAPEAVKELPLALALSGPAAGVAAAGSVARELDLDRVVSFDMGGTTTDVCLIVEGDAQVSSERLLAGRPVRQPMVAVESIGAGGGSMAIAEAGAIRVGPQSAGAEPGPACYGLGGSRPTVSDANLVLGYLRGGSVLGGSVSLNEDAAHRVIGDLATTFGVGATEAALGIYRVANASMTRALRRVTVERGVDARDCTLLAFGGAGPMHAVALARQAGISRVVVPRFSSVFSALGCLTAKLSYARQQTVRMPSHDWDGERLAALRADLLARLSAPLVAAGHDANELHAEDIAAVRYAGQSYAVEVPYTAPTDPARLGADFKARHAVLYGFATNESWELESVRLSVSAPPRARLEGLPRPSAPGPTEAHATLPAMFESDGMMPTPRFNRGEIGTRQRIEGPAVIEDDFSTVVVDPGAAAYTDAHGHLRIDVGATQ